MGGPDRHVSWPLRLGQVGRRVRDYARDWTMLGMTHLPPARGRKNTITKPSEATWMAHGSDPWLTNGADPVAAKLSHRKTQ